jgi:RNA polymerase sigma factor (sigma-70 family)
MGDLTDYLRRVVRAGGEADRTDGQLLEDYLSRRDEAAVAALVKRHGPMVWGVCRRLLHHHDAEDAFQATFLVLARRAVSVRPREMVGNWLFGVAHQTALKARATAAKRRMRERQVKEIPEPAAMPEPDLCHNVEPILDQELTRLPDKYRIAIVLCDLQGKTRKEVARQLRIPEGTLSSRLTTARAMLAKRLSRHGLEVAGGALASMLAEKAASAGVPNSVVDSTINAASLLAAGKAATGAISVKVAALTEGVMKGMLFTKLRTVVAVVLILGFAATGTTILTCRTAGGQDDKKPTAEKPVEPAAKQGKEGDRDTVTAWGEEAAGLQAGLGIRPGERRICRPGERVTLVVRVRNVSKKEVKFEYLRQFLDENTPTVTDADGKTTPQEETAVLLGDHLPVEVSLAPGKEIELESRLGGASGLRFQLLRASDREKPSDRKFRPLFVGTGKVSVQYGRVLGNSSSGTITLDPALSNLATGKLELEIKSDPPATERAATRTETAPVVAAFPSTSTLAAGQDEKKPPKSVSDRDKLQGTWRIVEVIVDGQPARRQNPTEEANMVVQGDQMSLVALPEGKKVKEFRFKIDPAKMPKAIDLSVPTDQAKGKTGHGIYELEGDRWKLCFPQDDNAAKERPTSFKSEAGSRLVLMTLKREVKR